MRERIIELIKEQPENLVAYNDLLSWSVLNDDHTATKWLRGQAARQLRADPEGFYSVYKRAMLFDAVVDFDSYMLYLELDREPSARFYQPRRKRLLGIVQAIQRLIDGDLDELFFSLPPRTGKTTLLSFLVTWLIGRESERSNLYSAYSDTITKAFYDGVLEILTDDVTYHWTEVFPAAKLVRTNAADETLDIDRRKRYPSLTCRSLYGTLNGACDCNGLMIADDLIGGIEEALNPDRMMSAWSKVDNNLIPRTKQKARMLWCGTRWSLIDPIGLRMELVKNDKAYANRRFEIISIPALDENDESNFDYEYDLGFSTELFHQRRASFERNNDMASWNAQYMQQPIEREGALFMPGDMKFYNGVLPAEAPDRVFIAIDPAFGGGDFVAAPICYQYGSDIYVHDVVYSSEDKRVTIPLLASAVKRHGVTGGQMEANKAVEAYRDEFLAALGEYRLNLISKPAPTTQAKWSRILDKSPDIREHMIFIEDGKRSREYSLFMQNVFSYKILGKNKHDDAPDSLAMAADFALGNDGKFTVFKRKW